MLNRFVGLTVSIVGKIDTVAGSTAIITTSDNKKVSVYSPNGFSFEKDKVVEFIGVVNPNGSINAQYSMGFTGDYSASAYNKLVSFMNGKFHGEVELSAHPLLSYYRKERRFKAVSLSTLLNIVLDVGS
ncbi:uncharacterized protein [Blastocystis hominis]|uniref:Uncharacterized protein n=1 Tax=Blastocystis hominis TaxID=12968 RepID=D8M1R2_BLAHO|nr:uncharacterized protein [Blastocystis hominis]CBK22001.2 unnamed protein product [Blastocystis hominis]|eukprot:XP_012896049.1 uncharacterized protein [Blastocystis hominis]